MTPSDALAWRRHRRGSDVSRAISIAELRTMALRRLPAFAAEYLEGGSEDELSLKANRQAFERLSFRPRLIASDNQEGAPKSFPYVIAPTGLNALYWRDADCALAEAAAQAGVPFTQSTVSNAMLELIAQTRGLEHWFQLYLFSTMRFVEGLLDRAAASGITTLVVTVDANTFGNREWNTRLYRTESSPTLRTKLDALTHPRWLKNVYAHGHPGFPNISDWLGDGAADLLTASRWLRQNMAPRVTWQELEQVRRHWTGTMLIKGIGHLEDARRAMEIGAQGVILGNHGGRQLDGAVPGMALLPEVRQTLGREATILVEGGVRRGADVLKARLLGADAVMGGRATLYGVAAGGRAGASRALAILREEYDRALLLLGAGDLGLTGSGDGEPVGSHPRHG